MDHRSFPLTNRTRHSSALHLAAQESGSGGRVDQQHAAGSSAWKYPSCSKMVQDEHRLGAVVVAKPLKDIL
jgi:hypothetical protein